MNDAIILIWLIISSSLIACVVVVLNRHRKPKTRLSDIIRSYPTPPPPITKSIWKHRKVVQGVGAFNINYCNCQKYSLDSGNTYTTIECEVCRKKRERKVMFQISKNAITAEQASKSLAKFAKDIQSAIQESQPIPPTDYSKGRNGIPNYKHIPPLPIRDGGSCAICPTPNECIMHCKKNKNT